MPPLTLALTLTADIDPPIASPVLAHQLGKEIARLADAKLAGASMSADRGRTTWTVIAPKPASSYSYALLELERSVHTVVRQTDGWEDARIVTADLRASTNEEVARRVAEGNIPDVVGVDEFCELLGTVEKPLSRQRLYALRTEQPDQFPAELRRGIWLRSMAAHYASTRNRRPGRPAQNG